MKKHIFYSKQLLLSFFAILYFLPCSFSQQIPMEGFIGINISRDMPIDWMQAAGFVREYHRASFDEGFPALNTTHGLSSPGYPNSLFKFNPSYQTQVAIPFDDYYQDITNTGLEISVALLQSAPYMYETDENSLTPNYFDLNNILEQKPMYPGNDPLDPNSYLAHAEWMYHFTARYGFNTFSQNKTDQIIAPHLHPDETVVTGLGQVEYIEDWNEPDKWWIPQYPSTYFSPAEYAVMMSADYDGHQNTMGLIPNPDNPSEMISAVGIKNADPNAKVVMTGLSDLDLGYFQGMVEWMQQNRDPNGPNGQYAFDVISYHHYSNNDPDLNHLGTAGVSPEEDLFKQKLLPLVAYRDQLFPEKELWLSEFGYDVDPVSNQRVPWEGIGNADRQEVQAQWIIRSFLEIAASGFDRAIIYELRDACLGQECGLFQASGLVDRDYNPRKSWYYVYTMKNVLGDYIFDGELSPCQDFDCNTNCPRVYRFVNPNDTNDKIFALWSPTSCDKPAYNYSLNLEGENTATLIEFEAPSTEGVKSSLFGNNVNISITERPVFVKVGAAETSPAVSCVSNVQLENTTCSSAQITWNSSSNIDNIDLWYFDGFTNDFNLLNGKFVENNIPVENGEYNITGLISNSNYTVVAFARDAQGNVSPPCPIQITTGSSTCKITIDPAWIYDSSNPENHPTQLFDEQANHDPICNFGGNPTTTFGFTPDNENPTYVSIDLQEYYNIDAFYIFDAQDFGNFHLEYAEMPNGPWISLETFQTIEYGIWETIDNILPSDTPVRYLRFSVDGDDRGLINELILCGRASDFAGNNISPSPPINFIYSGNSCNSLRFSWEAPFDTDIVSYEINYNGQIATIPSTNESTYSHEIFNLNTESNYNITARTLDADGNYSAPINLNASTLSNAECIANCDNTCACRICIQSSWIQNMTPASGIHPENLVDEQYTNPVCGTGGNPNTEWGENYQFGNGVPPIIAVIDLQECFALSAIHIYDGAGADILRIEYKNEDNWILISDYLTNKSNEWHSFSNLGFSTRYLRFTKMGNQAKINEIAICGTPGICGECTFTEGTACDDGQECTTNDVYNNNCQCIGQEIDNNNNGIPDICEDENCDYLIINSSVTNASCGGVSDGSIQITLPDCPNGGGAGGGDLQNLALNGIASQSSIKYGAEADRAIDGNSNGNFWSTNSCSATEWQIQPWWQVDLGTISTIQNINIYNRTDCCTDFFQNYYVLISDTPFSSNDLNTTLGQANVSAFLQNPTTGTPTNIPTNVSGRYVRIQLQGSAFLVIAEVEIMGMNNSGGGGNDCTFTYDWNYGIGNINNPNNLPEGTYFLTVTDGNGCSEMASIVVENETLDNDNDGIPNGCDDTPNGNGGNNCDDFEINYTQENISCNGEQNGSISIELPCMNDNNSGNNTASNLALNQTATQSGVTWEAVASRAVDGNTNGNFWAELSVTGTAWSANPWWQVDLGQISNLQSVEIYNRTDCCSINLSEYYILISNNPFSSNSLNALLQDPNVTSYFEAEMAGSPTTIPSNTSGRYVRVQMQGGGILSLAEVRVMGSIGGGNDCDLSINWNNGLLPLESHSNLVPGIYSVSVTDNLTSCTESISISITEPSALVCLVNNIQGVSSNGTNDGSATAIGSGGTAPYSFAWNNGQNTSNLNNVSAGTYTVTVTDANGCTCITTAIIDAPDGASLALNCPNDQTIVASENISVTWPTPMTNSSCNTGNILLTQTSGLPNGSIFALGSVTTIIYQATDGCGNVDVCDFEIRVDEFYSNLTLNCPNNISVETSNPNGTNVNWALPAPSTDCAEGIQSLVQVAGLQSGSLFPLGTTTITYQAVDYCGSVELCSFVVTVNQDSGPPPNGYCASQGDEPWWQWISHVNFVDIDHESSKDLYGDFTNIETDVNRDESYTITLTPEFSWLSYDEYWRVWIDFNRDGDFVDGGEMVYEDHGNGVLSGNISIPNSASLGKTRMRIAMKNGSYAQPCETFQYGEVEDYLLDIRPMTVGLTVQEYLTFDAEKEGRNVRLHWTTNITDRTDKFILEQSENGLDFHEIHTRFIGEEEYDQVFDYYDYSPKLGRHYYRLKQVFEDNSSQYSDIRRLDFDLDINAFDIFPNPTKNTINIALRSYLNQAIEVQLYNQYGQLLKEQKTDSLSDEILSFDVSSYTPGLYFVKVQVLGLRQMSRRFVISR